MPTVIICSLFLAFFAAFVSVYFLAKLTSAPSDKKNDEEDEFGLAGSEFDCKLKNIRIHSRVSDFYIKPKEEKNTDNKR